MKHETHRRRSAPTRARRTRAQQAQHRRFVLVVCLLVLMVVITAVATHSCKEEGIAGRSPSGSTTTSTALPLVSAIYTAQLTPGESQPTATTPVAVLTLDFDATAGTLAYRLEVTTQLADPSIAAICQGSPGAHGATLFTLFPGPSVAGDFSGVLAEGTISAVDLVGPLQGATLEDLVRLMEDGGVYATIGTRQFPIDAVRGQIG